ncbi:MAG: aldo/keto reductase [Anaerolineaceae bacterium]|nr:aldo/keto reductase [Anaerolineaceae bacterium]
MTLSSQITGNDFFADIDMGVGTWAWGDRLYWGYGDAYGEFEIQEAFNESIASGITFFDTAEVYGQGKSELLLGKLIKTTKAPLKIATKMMPFPWRISARSLKKALTASLKRLGLSKIDLYQMHWPLKPVPVTEWMNRMADLVEEGLVIAVGVSNYNLGQIISAHEVLRKRGLALTSVQLEYHLLNRNVEHNGIMDYCREQGIKLISYSPLASGVLTGKYSAQNPPRGGRAIQYDRSRLEKIQPLLRTMIRIGNEHDGKTAGQVALNWIMRKGALPIPGAKNIDQMAQNLGARGWQLEESEMGMLDEISRQVTQPIIKN